MIKRSLNLVQHAPQPDDTAFHRLTRHNPGLKDDQRFTLRLMDQPPVKVIH
jgi:hypothetical protein